MKLELLYSGVYEDILYTLKKWRILDLPTLFKKTEFPHSYQAFSKKVIKLEQYKMVESAYLQGYRKYIYLTDKGIREVGDEKQCPINPDILIHDLTCVNVMEYFISLDSIVFDAKFYLNDGSYGKEPDLVLIFGSGQQISVEVELSAKSYERIENKFRYYAQSNQFKYTIYLFQKSSVFEMYKKALIKVDQNIDPMKLTRAENKIILVFEPELRNKKFDLMKSITLYRGSISTLEQVLNGLVKTRLNLS